MTLSTVNWLWIGNIAMLDSTPATSITVAERQAITGYEASGSSEIQAIAVTGDYTQVGSSSAFQFATYWNATANGIPPTSFSYSTAETTVTNVTMISAFAVTMTVQTGSDPDVYRSEPATLVQMSNGDVFFRPNAAYVDSWSGITSVYSIKVTAVDSAVTSSYGSINHRTSFNPSIFNVAFPCFAADTLIETEEGMRAAGTLKVGDRIRIAGEGFQAIRWISSRKITKNDFARNKALLPIRIAAGSLGTNMPQRDLVVSQQHRILIRSRIAMRMFDTEEILVAAKHLVGAEGIDIMEDCIEVEYVHFMFDRHHIVLAEGSEVESLYAGPETLKVLPDECRREILALFPELNSGSYPAPARPFVRGKRSPRMVARHTLANQALVSRPDMSGIGHAAGHFCAGNRKRAV